MNQFVNAVVLVAFLPCLILSSARASEPVKVSGIDPGSVAIRVIQVVEYLQLADKLTVKRGKPTTQAVGAPKFIRKSLVDTYEVVEMADDSFTNSVLGREIPGRRVNVTIKIPVRIQVWLHLDRITAEADPDYPKDTVRVYLPCPEVTVEPGEGEYEFDYGVLRTAFLDREKAIDVRNTLAARSVEQARNRFEQEYLIKERKQMEADVGKILRGKTKGKRVILISRN